ncbi:MAG TPA: hypothetical protein VKB13_08240 [Gaiellaceae bacterium]|nr:hypothetical protein [Gaiellaceae bacterium]
MRLAKALLAVALSAGSLAAAAVAAVPNRPPMQDGTLSVRDGRASIVLKMKGSIIGRLAKGTVTVTDPGADATVIVRGADSERYPTEKTTVYGGKGIRFRVADDGRVTVKVTGKGINFSAVGRGDGWVDGWGDPAAGLFFDGAYSLNGEDYASLPNERMRFELAAPASP